MSTANFSKKHNLPVMYLIRVFMSSLREENPRGDTSGRFSRYFQVHHPIFYVSRTNSRLSAWLFTL